MCRPKERKSEYSEEGMSGAIYSLIAETANLMKALGVEQSLDTSDTLPVRPTRSTMAGRTLPLAQGVKFPIETRRPRDRSRGLCLFTWYGDQILKHKYLISI